MKTPPDIDVQGCNRTRERSAFPLMMGTCMPLLVVTTVVGVPSASIQEMVEASVEFADALNARELQDNAPRSKNLLRTAIRC